MKAAKFKEFPGLEYDFIKSNKRLKEVIYESQYITLTHLLADWLTDVDVEFGGMIDRRSMFERSSETT